MEPLTTVGAGLAILGSKDILVKILGPSAAYIGERAKGLLEKLGVYEKIAKRHICARGSCTNM